MESSSDNWTRTSFEPTVLMSTYLLAFAISDYSNVSKSGDVQFNVWSRDSQINQTKFALDIGPKVLTYFADLYNYKFPLRKLDMIAIPDFSAGAMENWGLITFREVDLLLDESQRPSLMTKMQVARVISHELAHQWFGNLVTMKWWDSIWLNEGFADYVSFNATQHVLSEWPGEMDIQFVYEQVQMAMSQDQLPSSPPIRRTSGQDDVHLYFDYITYKKGSSIIRMLHRVLQDLFNVGLHAYMVKNAYANVVEDDLWIALQKAVDLAERPPWDWNGKKLNVSSFMNNWINLPGFPVVTIARVNISHVRLSQKPYSSDLYQGAVKYSVGHQWYIPLWYETCSGNGEQFMWLQPNKDELLNIPFGCPFVANIGARSYLRVLYPSSQAPTDFPNSNLTKMLDSINTAQLIDDAFNLAKAGLTNYSDSLNVPFLLLKTNAHPVPLKTAFVGYQFLRTMLSDSSEAQNLLTRFVSNNIIKYSKDFWNQMVHSENFTLRMRSEILVQQACRWNVSECIEQANSSFVEFLSSCNGTDNGTSKCSEVPLNLRKTVYCVGVSVNEGSFDTLWKWCQKELFNSERNNLVAGLGCSRRPADILKLLNASLQLDTDCVKLQDVSYLFSNINANPFGRPLLWTFMQQHWREYIDKDMKNSLRALASQSVSSFSSESDVAKVEEFLSRPELCRSARTRHLDINSCSFPLC
uniref:Aminopeptidase n=1 Tax=Trichuris muris TaxID=70415 RepID=A0A5S6R1H9_TRIMR